MLPISFGHRPDACPAVLSQCSLCLYKLLIFYDHLRENFSVVFAHAFFLFLRELIPVDRFSVFDDNVLWLYLRQMLLEDCSGIVEGDGDDRDFAPLRDFEAAVVEGSQLGFLTLVARSFRENEDRDPFLPRHFRSGHDCFHALTQILAVKEKAVQEHHIPGEERPFLERFFRYVSCLTLHLTVAYDDIEEALMVPDEKDSLVIRDVVKTEGRQLHSRHVPDYAERTLHDPLHDDVSLLRVDLSDEKKDQHDRTGENKIEDEEQRYKNKSYHSVSLLE